MKMKWTPWQSTNGGGGETTTKKKLQVKVSRLELRGLEFESENAEVLAMEVKWKGPNSNTNKPGLKLVPFYGRSSRSRHQRRDFTVRKGFHRGETVAWDDEFENVCEIPSFCSDWSLVFSLLYGERAGSKRKMAVLGKVWMNLRRESEIERKFPMMFKVGGSGNRVVGEATLSVCVSSVEVQNSEFSTGIIQDSSECDRDRLLSRLTYFRSFRKMDKAAAAAKASPEQETARSDRDDSPLLDSGGSPRIPDDPATTRVGDSESSPSQETRPEPATDLGGLLALKKRRLGEWALLRNVVSDDYDCRGPQFSTGSFPKPDSREFYGGLRYACEDYWNVKELVSKDGQSKLKTSMLFAPFDQRGRMAGGATACTAISVVNANWLHANRDLPTSFELASLIIQGSIEWRRLCQQEVYRRLFPDRHFDLETVLSADIRPLAVLPEKSFIGFFSPNKFESLKEAMSFDQIWDEMSGETIGYEPRIYIVSWNDHFFVLKREEDAYYIIDSLGARLFDGCYKGYILKFDDSSVMYGKDVEIEGSEELVKPIFHGKECCREFMKRFLAAQTVKELEEADKKGLVSTLALYQRLQIELHYTYSTLPMSPSSSADSSTLSLCSSEEFLQNLN